MSKLDRFSLKVFGARRLVDSFNNPTFRLLLEYVFDFCIVIKRHRLIISVGRTSNCLKNVILQAMKMVAKAVIIDEDGKYLLMKRSNHPRFLNDPDLPGGTIEEGESPLIAMIREVIEEAGIMLDPNDVTKLYQGDDYSYHHTEYSLYEARLAARPDVTISWEHDSYAWVTREEFLRQAQAAADTYMHMVYEVLK
jgi:8-oxo-dGTP pyrophosphatase MutT (NUDIX family)